LLSALTDQPNPSEKPANRFHDGAAGQGLQWGICHGSMPDGSVVMRRFKKTGE
jgi:hypothetical protein